MNISLYSTHLFALVNEYLEVMRGHIRLLSHRFLCTCSQPHLFLFRLLLHSTGSMLLSCVHDDRMKCFHATETPATQSKIAGVSTVSMRFQVLKPHRSITSYPPSTFEEESRRLSFKRMFRASTLFAFRSSTPNLSLAQNWYTLRSFISSPRQESTYASS